MFIHLYGLQLFLDKSRCLKPNVHKFYTTYEICKFSQRNTAAVFS